ncbi:MAG: AraC family transcriptional regulator [Clostridia bacterium]|nr:AraC family transcriptional regulator [Clostridia bacterium]
MVFYAIRLKNQPQVQFAASITMEITQEKHNIIDHREGILEFSFFTAPCGITADGKHFDVGSGNIITLVPSSLYTISLPEMGAQERSSFTLASAAVFSPQMTVEQFDTEAKMPEPELWDDPDMFFLPLISSLTEEEYQQAAALITSIIDIYAAGRPSSRWLCLSDFYELIALLDTALRNTVQAVSRERYQTGTRYYIRKARKYIEAHFCGPLTLSEVAAHLEISPGYLCSLYRAATGRTVIETIQYLRVQKLRSLISAEPEKTMRELCTQVGFRDVRYVQRLFKRYYGISMQQCRKIDRGVSLYHENPWEKSDLDHDIFYDTPHPDESEE